MDKCDELNLERNMNVLSISQLVLYKKKNEIKSIKLAIKTERKE